MPAFRNLTVSVTDSKNKPLAEWGIRRRNRACLSTCYIQSETNMRFHIMLQPEIPYPAFRFEESDYREESPAPSSSTPAFSESEERYRARRRDMNRRFPPPAPWHLLATLRIDGRPDHEKRTIIYLDQYHPLQNGEDNMIIMKHRALKDQDGQYRDCGWLFRDVGIENVFDKLMVDGDGDDSPAQDEDDLLAAFTGLDADLCDSEEQGTVGQIEIVFKRVTVGRTRPREGGPKKALDEDVSMTAGDASKISHTIGRDEGKVRMGGYNVIEYEYVDRHEPAYATFKFYYRSEDVLRKFGFPGFSPKAPSPTDRRRRQRALAQAAASPLSIVKREGVDDFSKDDKAIKKEEGDEVVIDSTGDEKTISPTSNIKGWVPKNNKFPVIAISDDSPPGSPPSEYDKQDTAHARSADDKNVPFSSPAKSIKAEESSADESSPFKLPFKPSPGIAAKFRMLGDVAEGEEADDEASDAGDNTHHLVNIGEEAADNGISRNMPDEGLGVRLTRVVIGSKRSNASDDGTEGDEEESIGQSKKAKVDGVAVAQASEQSIMVAGAEAGVANEEMAVGEEVSSSHQATSNPAAQTATPANEESEGTDVGSCEPPAREQDDTMFS